MFGVVAERDVIWAFVRLHQSQAFTLLERVCHLLFWGWFCFCGLGIVAEIRLSRLWVWRVWTIVSYQASKALPSCKGGGGVSRKLVSEGAVGRLWVWSWGSKLLDQVCSGLAVG